MKVNLQKHPTGSMADEIGLSIGDEIIAIGNETLPRYATAKV